MIDPSFQGKNRLFLLPFSDNTVRTGNKRYFLPDIEIKDYNVMTDGQNLFDQSVKSNMRTYGNIRKIPTCHRDDSATGCLLGYPYFKDHYSNIVIDLSKQQTLDVDPKTIQLVNSTGYLNNRVVTIMFFIIEETKGTILDCSQESLKVL